MQINKDKVIQSIPFFIILISLIYSTYMYVIENFIIDFPRQIGLGLLLTSLILYLINQTKIAIYLLIIGLFIATFLNIIYLLPEHLTIWFKLGFIELLIPTFECFLLIIVVICGKDFHRPERQKWIEYWNSLPR